MNNERELNTKWIVDQLNLLNDHDFKIMYKAIPYLFELKDGFKKETNKKVSNKKQRVLKTKKETKKHKITLAEALANTLYWFRTTQGVSEKKLCNKSGLSLTALDDLEKGKSIDFKTIDTITNALSLNAKMVIERLNMNIYHFDFIITAIGDIKVDKDTYFYGELFKIIKSRWNKFSKESDMFFNQWVEEIGILRLYLLYHEHWLYNDAFKPFSIDYYSSMLNTEDFNESTQCDDLSSSICKLISEKDSLTLNHYILACIKQWEKSFSDHDIEDFHINQFDLV